MPQRSLGEVFVLFLGLSYVVCSAAVPATRSLKSTQLQDPSISSVQELLVQIQGGAEVRDGAEEGLMERRVDIQLLDYPGSSASHSHDPRTPPRP